MLAFSHHCDPVEIYDVEILISEGDVLVIENKREGLENFLNLELNVVLDLCELLHNIVPDRRRELVLASRRCFLVWVVLLGTGHGDHAKEESSNG
jgi:hypothetical protein